MKMAYYIIIGSILSIMVTSGCTEIAKILQGEEPEQTSELRIEDVKDRHEAKLMGTEGVVGVGIGECEGTPCIKVFVIEKTPEVEAMIPKEIEGFKVDIEESGEIIAQ